jgi:putative membrane protein
MNVLNNLTSLAVVGLVALTGCSKDSASSAAPGASEGSEAAPAENAQKSGKMTALTDGQIMQVLANVDSGEIEQAQIALSKATSPAVREFAQHMVDQHTQSKQDAQQLLAETKIIPSPSEPADEVHTKGSQVLDKLNSADAASFDSTYIHAQVKQHEDVLKLLNDKLIPSASTTELRDALQKTKSMVQHHIDMAKKIEA